MPKAGFAAIVNPATVNSVFAAGGGYFLTMRMTDSKGLSGGGRNDAQYKYHFVILVVPS